MHRDGRSLKVRTCASAVSLHSQVARSQCDIASVMPAHLMWRFCSLRSSCCFAMPCRRSYTLLPPTRLLVATTARWPPSLPENPA